MPARACRGHGLRALLQGPVDCSAEAAWVRIYDGPTRYSPMLAEFVCESIVDWFFVADIGINFFTGYFRAEELELQTSHRKI